MHLFFLLSDSNEPTNTMFDSILLCEMAFLFHWSPTITSSWFDDSFLLHTTTSHTPTVCIFVPCPWSTARKKEDKSRVRQLDMWNISAFYYSSAFPDQPNEINASLLPSVACAITIFVIKFHRQLRLSNNNCAICPA